MSRVKRIICLICAIAVFAAGITVVADDTTAETGINRYNVVLLLDASGSMKDTDPNGYRYDALDQFMFMLADSGNQLGCVVFDHEIRAQYGLTPVSSQADKDNILNILESEAPRRGWTNIGDALDASVEMIKTTGDPNLPSVIVFLSDGNTEMKTDKQTQQSLDAKAEALEKARNEGISIYSVCLNVNNKADVTEMQQLSDATGGVFNEVTGAEDLQDVLATFYALIYDTTPVPFNEVFPENGEITKVFDIPGLGVEEANFLMYGKIDSVDVLGPSGSAYNAETLIKDTCTMTKVMNPEPGTCTVTIHGEPGTTIYGNMIYNVNLTVSGGTDLSNNVGTSDTPVNFYVQLGTGSVMAQDAAQYNGFSAELILKDAYGNDRDTIPMTLGDNGFVASSTLEEGAYFFVFRVTGYDLDKVSETYGPFDIVAPTINNETPTPKPNHAPEPVEDEVKYEKYVIPFMDNTLEIPVSGLATDAEDAKLVYQIESTSFQENVDYTFDGDVITMTHYSLTKGDYVIKAIDSRGLSCEIKVIVKAIPVALITVITLGIIALLVVTGVVLSLWYWKLRRLRGMLIATDQSGIQNVVSGGRGQIRLNRLIKSYAGFDPRKSYIQCTGKDYVYFKSNKEFIAGTSREKVKKVKIRGNNSDVFIHLPENVAGFNIKFQPRETKKARPRSGRNGGARAGSRRTAQGAGSRRPAQGRTRPSAGRRNPGGHGTRR